MSGLARLLGRRLIGVVAVLLGITIYMFVLLEASPIDPRYAALGTYATQQQRDAYAAEHHLDDPLPLRYATYLGDLAQGDLGTNSQGAEITTLLGKAIPVTFSLAGVALVWGLVIAFALGISAAYFAGGRWDNVVRIFAFAGLSLPTFWLGLVLIQFVALRAGLLPTGGYVPIADGVASWFEALLLPALTLAIPMGCYLTRIVRASVIDELESDYVRTARGAGVPERKVVLLNVLRNALVAPLTVAGLQAGYLLSGAVLVEVVFNLPGIGLLLWQGGQQGDLGITVGIALVAAVVFVGANLLVDVLTFIVSPRTREA